MITRTAMIAIVGRANVGKSTLTNRLVGQKVAIVTDKPQTTRNRICAVLNRDDTQIVFMDTPGFHKARTRLGDYMVNVVRQSVADVDAAILMVEPYAGVGERERELITRISDGGAPAILVVNKIDSVKKEELLAVIDLYSKEYGFDAIVPISAKTGEGVEILLDELMKYALDGPALFPDGMISDCPEKVLIAETLREKLLICLDAEVPHGVAVEVTKFSEREGGIIDIDVTIYCEKKSHKGIIIGKNGAMLKRVGELAREDIESFMGAKVFLSTWVKVKESWRDSEAQLRNFGYTE